MSQAVIGVQRLRRVRLPPWLGARREPACRRWCRRLWIGGWAHRPGGGRAATGRRRERRPAVGPHRHAVTLTATGLREGETVTFEITFPEVGKAFSGGPLALPADGVATATYRATAANQPGV